MIPNSVLLWKEAIALEDDPNEARILLSSATEQIPHSVEFWLALARLETYDRAKIVINSARKKLPTSHEIWIEAAKLEEVNGETDKVEKIIERAIQLLANKGVVLEREQWLSLAMEAEEAKCPITCQAIVKNTIELGLDPEDRKSTWLEDVDNCVINKSYITARAIFEYATTVFKDKKGLWRRAAQFELSTGDRERMFGILDRAVQYCPNAEVLWLMRAKETWLDV